MGARDYRTRFGEQLDFLPSSIAACNAGNAHEATRLSVAIRNGGQPSMVLDCLLRVSVTPRPCQIPGIKHAA
jgi:hypothetical protein